MDLQENKTRVVVKRDGSIEPFDATKIERWAEYAAKHNVNWKGVAINVISRLPMRVKTEEIHQVMVDYCLAQDNLRYSRVAARLVYAQLRKNMQRELGVTDRSKIYDIVYALWNAGLWSYEVLKAVGDNEELVQQWYEEIFPVHLESWQVMQWADKYAIKKDGIPVETPHVGALGIAIAIHGVTDEAFRLSRAIIEGKINLPTPVLNGCRNGDFDSISCSVITGGDTVDSIGVAEHLAYKMTAKKAGIGIEMRTRSAGDDVKNGRIKHLGKHPIYAAVDKAVKMFTQVSRGGSATMTFSCYDPEIMMLLKLKSQRTPLDVRLDKMDYSMAYDDAFLEAVIRDQEVELKNVQGKPAGTVKARDILKAFLTARAETGRVYCINLSEANRHTPFLDPITLSNLCQEICLPTKPFKDMLDLYNPTPGYVSEGEIAFCSLAAINVYKVDEAEYEDIAYLAVKTVDNLIDRAPALSPAVAHKLQARRSLGIGITGLAGWLGEHSLRYADTASIEALAERHYYWCLKASQRLVLEGRAPVSGIREDWLPIDTGHQTVPPTMDWESLRGKPRRNSVLVAHMPTESSAVFSDAPNGLYPVRDSVIAKASRYGLIKYIAPDVCTERAWDVGNDVLARAYGAVQSYTDQAISADYYVTPSRYPGGKVPMSVLIKEWVIAAKAGVKTMYYSNTNDFNGGAFSQQDGEGCDGACKL